MAATINGDGLITLDGTTTTQGRVRLAEDTDNGTNYVELQAPASIASNVTFTLPSADGSNGQLLQTNGAGALSFTNPTSLATPLTVTGDATAGAELRLPEDTDNGSNYVAVKAPNSLASNVTCTLPSTTSTLGYINLPAVGTQTGSYTLATTDIGKYVQVGSGGSITIPDATFSEGDAISIFNNTTGNITITCSITTAYIAGTDTDKASVTLATRGVATVLFISGTVCVISGNVS
jgi:hypothetical protein